MSNEQPTTQETLVPTDNRGLTAPSGGLVRRGLHMVLTEQVQRDTLWETHNNAGIEAFEQGRYSEAETSFLAALREAERFGSQDLRLAKSLHNLANAYYKQGNCAEAEPLYERALAIAEKAIGLEHPDVATFLSNLAWVYHAQHRSAEAEPLFQRALAIRERVLGPEHPDVARNLVGLASSYDDQFKFAEAEPLYRRALAILEKTLGPEDPTVSGVVRMLEMFYLKVLMIQERSEALGPEHPDVATSLHNLAVLYHAQGRYSEADSLYRRVFAIREKAMGWDHPDTAATLHNLENLFCDMATSSHSLAMHSYTQGQYAEAERFFKQALAKEKALGSEHPIVAAIREDYTTLLRRTHRDVEAEKLEARVKAIRAKEASRYQRRNS